MKNEVAFRKRLYKDALRKEQEVKNASCIDYGLELSVLNLERLFKSDMKDGIGLVLDTHYDEEYKDIASYMSDLIDGDSLYSYKFSIRSNDTQFAKANRYRCKCGKTSSELAGTVCKKCGTETYNHIAIRGWFDLGNLKVFNPFYWAILKANCEYPSIVDFAVKELRDRNAEIRRKLHDIETASNKQTAQQKMNDIERIKRMPTMIDFQDKNVLKDFIKEYASEDAVDYLLKNIDSAMTSKIPVTNKNFRNVSIRVNLYGRSDAQKDEHSKHYTCISRAVDGLINTMSSNTASSTIRRALVSINYRFSCMYDAIIDILGKNKSSLIRGRVGGRRKGYSSRIVLEGALRHKIDEVAMPYKFFGQMTIDYHYDLYHELGVTPEAAYRIKNNIPNLSDCQMMDKVLAKLTKDNMNVVIVLRQPAIYRESLVALRLVELHHKDVVTLNEMVIDSCLFGDKDGDVVSVFMPDPSIRTQLLFSMSPNKLIFNPLTASVNGSMELVEAGYVNVCLVLPKERKGSIITTKEELKKLGYKV